MKQNTWKGTYITIRVHNLQNYTEACKTYNLYMIYDRIYLLTATGLTPGGISTVQYSTVHTYTQTVHRTTQ